jgi:threonylcarbamoyladenosine tRNA methylthiotransferase MtaB
VLDEARRRVEEGQPEMVLTGISVGDYRDPASGMELGDLMCSVARVPGVERVRLSSVEVIHVKDSLVRALAGEPKVCPHLHIPLQSGDDEVLRAMGRHYTAAEYLDHVRAVRKAVPAVNITTDVIVGFPTEDEGAFERTVAIVEAAGITRVHTFSYSPRPGTVAEALGDRVPPEEKKRRSQAMRGHSEVRSRMHRAGKLGRGERVLVDKVAETQCSGYTADYTRCYLPAGVAARGQLVDGVCLELHADGIACGLPEAPGLS